MHENGDSIESLLLDYHLNRLDGDQAAQVERALGDSPELSARSRGLRQALDVLDSDEVPQPRADLAESVMARIGEQTRTIPFEKAATVVPAGSGHDLSASPVMSFRELIAIAACITLLIGIGVPGYRKAQSVARRNLCRTHQAQMWQGMASYAAANDDYLAWTGHVPGGSWLATNRPNVQRYSNSRPLFILLRRGYIRDRDPRVFNCPSDPTARPMLVDDYDAFDDFAEPANVSYSALFMNRPQGLKMHRVHRRMVLIGDANPLFDPRPVAHRVDAGDDVGNSLIHDSGAGQNAVYVTGQGGWFTQPTIGVEQDNIYLAGDLTHYEGTETPVSETDTLLVP